MTLENLDTVIAFTVVILLLSLVITTCVQMVSWLLRFRENILRWGIERLLVRMVPTSVTTKDPRPFKMLAQEVVNHAALKHYEGRSATAISFDELVKVLSDILSSEPNKTKHAELLNVLGTAPVQEVTTLASALVEDLTKELPTEAPRVKAAVERVKKSTLEAGTKLRFWFDTVMDRSTARFTANARWVTIVAAVLLAFVARIDSVDLLRQLSQKADVRAKLVQLSEPATKQAAEILGAPSGPSLAQTTPAGVGPVPARTDAASSKELPLPAALATVKARHPEIPGDFVGPDSGDLEVWKHALAAKVPPVFEERILGDFTQEYSRQELARLTRQLGVLRDTLAHSSLEILPVKSFNWTEFPSHLPGILLSAFLLSLGAPFWFNALRQLSNLRPIVAGKVDAKSAQDAPT